MTARTPIASTVPEPHGKPGGPGLFHMKGKKAPPYIEHVAGELMKQGRTESDAYHEAVGIVENWAAGHDGHGNRVHPDVQAAAAKNIAEWEKLRAEAHASGGTRRSAVTVAERAQMTTASINDLDDDQFGYIQPGGHKDSSGKTTPRELRHFPIHDAAHVRNALARIGQGAQFGKQALPKVKAAAKKFGIDAGDGDSSDSGSRLRPYRPELIRWHPLEDIHILSRGEGDGSGRVVEAFAAVFDEPAEIKDFEGHYREVIDRSAFNKRLDDLRRSRQGFAGVKVMWNHGMTIHGTPSERFSMPVGVPVHIEATSRGLLTRTEYNRTPLAEEVLELIRSGAVSSQSFTGRIVRSDPQLGRGQQHRPRNGELPLVRRTELGLKEYGAVVWPAYDGAEILGVRMSTPGSDWEPDEIDDVALLPDVEAAAGEPLTRTESPEHSARYHQHALYVLRSQKAREEAGLVW